MSNFVTYETIETKVLTDLDLLDETFITGGVGSEVMGYCNDAIHVAESIILDLCEDYFKTTAYLPLVLGTSDYSFPADIYADKIRKLVYANGTLIYPIKKMWRSYAEEDTSFILQSGTAADRYRHMLLNDAVAGRKIRFYPPAFETSATNVIIWYIRSAKKVTAMSDTVDIPEFHSFIEKYMKMMCYEKEGHPNWQIAKVNVEEEKKLMIDALSEREPDTDTTIEGDYTFYQEHV